LARASRNWPRIIVGTRPEHIAVSIPVSRANRRLRAGCVCYPTDDRKPATYPRHSIHKENVMLQKILMTLMLLGAVAGCNTMQGFGQDVERTGEKIQEKATR
jgi:predicted small secreted protein